MHLPFFEELEHFIGKAKDNSGFEPLPWPIFFLGLSLLFLSFVFMPQIVIFAVQLALFLAPLWLPAILVSGALTLWLIWRQSEFIAHQKYIVLEIKPPRSIEKTPIAMEAVISGLHLAPGEATWYKRLIQGSMRPWWSLEIASLEGKVHFFIWTRVQFRRVIENQIYAQYPGAQVVEVPDYTRIITAKSGEWSVFGNDYKSSKPEPYPIKTYVDYGLDRPEKEPLQTDPLANLLEFLGSLHKGEYLWLQFIIRVHKGEKYGKKLNAAGKQYTWKDEAADLVQQIRAQTVGKVQYKDLFTGEMRETEGFPNPTKGQSEAMAAIERNVSKLAFDVGIRAVYIARPEKFDPACISGLSGLFKQFSSEGYNSLGWTRWLVGFDDYPWEIFVEKRKEEKRHELVEAFRRRSYFYEPFKFDNYSVMSTEELATLYHLPSATVETPTLPRIQSVTSDAPSNLPT